MYEWIAVIRAADTAARWHAHQRRKGADQEPYINHLLPLRTMWRASGGAGRLTPLRSERVRRGAKHPGCPSGYRLKTESRSNYSGRCEGNGRWWDEAEVAWRNGRGQRLRGLPPPDLSSSNLPMKRVALAMAHLDHDPTNDHPRNLKALCQRCHMIHDREEHLRRRARTCRARRAFGDLFAGPY
jgi:hypothetical protein